MREFGTSVKVASSISRLVDVNEYNRVRVVITRTVEHCNYEARIRPVLM